MFNEECEHQWPTVFSLSWHGLTVMPEGLQPIIIALT